MPGYKYNMMSLSNHSLVKRRLRLHRFMEAVRASKIFTTRTGWFVTFGHAKEMNAKIP